MRRFGLHPEKVSKKWGGEKKRRPRGQQLRESSCPPGKERSSLIQGRKGKKRGRGGKGIK